MLIILCFLKNSAKEFILLVKEKFDIKKENLNGLTYDQILNYLKKFKKEERLEKYKILLKFRNIPFDADLFTWNSD